MIWQIRNRTLDFQRTRLMGIVNVTPDSFSDGGKFQKPEAAVEHALCLVREGADLLDLGAESSRPGALQITAEEELGRIVPVLERLRKKTDCLISIDTEKAEVARKCLELGADVINDVSGLATSGEAMTEVVKRFGAGLVLMHRRGNPRTMQTQTQYESVVQEVLAELKTSIDQAIRAGIQREQVVIDPGLGFSKTAAQSWEIVRCLERFQELGFPVLLGHSRKSFLAEVSGAKPSGREDATTALSALAVMKGVQILRVHQLSSNLEAVRIAEKIRGEEAYVRTFKMGND